MDELISIVIPHRKNESADITLESLKKQTFQNFVIILVEDSEGRGANWARNEGFKQVKTPFVLFSDNDIEWESNALEILLFKLQQNPQASYSYGYYEIGDGVILGRIKFRPRTLVKNNFISTMSLIRTEDFPGFDENLKRLQDYDLFLTMLRNHKIGVYCGCKIFRTKDNNKGISKNNDLEEADKYIVSKHKLIRD